MSRQIYQNRQFKIYVRKVNGKDEYIVHNTKKSFENGHTHITDFSTAKYLTHLINHKIVPKHISYYLYNSIKRLCSDKEYLHKLRERFSYD